MPHRTEANAAITIPPKTTPAMKMRKFMMRLPQPAQAAAE
jgi:hypothetical protein